MRLRRTRSRRSIPVEALERRRLLSLTHLYTFNDGGSNDWIGSAHGTLVNGATITAGQLVLSNVGVTSGQTSVVQYMKLPADALPASGSATVSAWFTTSNAAVWSRLFDFGDQTGANGNSYLFFSPRGSGDLSRAALRPAGGTERAVFTTRSDNNTQHLATVVIDSAAALLRLYIDGAVGPSTSLLGAGVNSINDVNGFIGRSLFNADPGFTGSINEVRIYDDAQPGAAIAADFAQGPSALTRSPLVRQAEYLNRGVLAMRRSTSQMYINWRLLGTDPSGVAFNVYRSASGGAAVKINSSPLTSTTDFTDSTFTASLSNAYFIRAVVNGVEQAASEIYTTPANTPVRQYLNIPLSPPPVVALPDASTYTYNANDGSVADVDGDGQYEIILKWDPSNSKDNSQSGYTGPTYLDCYRLDGTLLWRINLGQNVRSGAHYEPFVAYDFDGDGKAEVAIRTAPGTIDGVGNPVLMGSDLVTDDYRNSSGYILTGPEYLTVFNGLTGANLATVALKPDRVNVSQWGDSYGNRVDRFNATVAYLDGQRPSIVVGRGYYGAQSSGGQVRNEITAWDYRNGQITMRWWFKAGNNINNNINSDYVGQGAHTIIVGDVDADGKDEVIYGAAAVDDNGAPLWNTHLGHGDAEMMTDMDPSRPGQEIFQVHESPSSFGIYGADLRDARTGQLLGNIPAAADVGRGNAMDIDPNFPGYEMWSSAGPDIINVSGAVVAPKNNVFQNFGVWWDADPLRELLDGTTIADWNYTIGGRSNFNLNNTGLSSNNSTKSTPTLSADILGDWREEVIWRTSDNTALQIWSTTITATSRLVTLMHDIQYREAISWQNSAYNQPPFPSYFLGSGMATPPMPNLYVVKSPAGATGSVAGQVFHDINADTLLNGTDVSQSGVTVYLDANSNGVLDGGELSTTTNAVGGFVFATVPTGTYTLREFAPAGFAAEIVPQITVGAGFAFVGTNIANARIVYTGTGSGDTYSLRRNSAGNFELTINGSLAYTIFAAAPSLTFNLSGGNDGLTLDAVAGAPVPTGGVIYDGGSGTDSLTVQGTSGSDSAIFGASGATIGGAMLVAGGGTGVTDTTLETIKYLSAGGTDTVTINGGPIVSLPDTTLPVLTVNSGGIASLPAAASGGGISVRNAASLTLNAGGALNVLTATNHTDRVLLVAASLSVAGVLDLGGNDLVARGANLATITNAIKSGLNLVNGGYWNGTSGITSSTAGADAGHLTALGVLLNNFNGQRIYGSGTVYGPFDGQDVTLADVLVKYTWFGDTDLSGRVNGGDYAKTDNGFNAGLSGWTNGDNNYDSVIDGADYSLIDNAFNSQGAVALAIVSDNAVSSAVSSATARTAGSETTSVPHQSPEASRAGVAKSSDQAVTPGNIKSSFASSTPDSGPVTRKRIFEELPDAKRRESDRSDERIPS